VQLLLVVLPLQPLLLVLSLVLQWAVVLLQAVGCVVVVHSAVVVCSAAERASAVASDVQAWWCEAIIVVAIAVAQVGGGRVLILCVYIQ
jgi:hypothetical protein